MRDDDAAERALWRRARGRPNQPDASAGVDDLTLAAWLDGRLADGDADAVDAALARDPRALDAALDARAALADPPAAQQRVVARAAALVPPRRARVAWRLAAAAALVAAAAAGYAMGDAAQAPRAAHPGDIDEMLQALEAPDEAAFGAEDDA